MGISKISLVLCGGGLDDFLNPCRGRVHFLNQAVQILNPIVGGDKGQSVENKGKNFPGKILLV